MDKTDGPTDRQHAAFQKRWTHWTVTDERTDKKDIGYAMCEWLKINHKGRSQNKQMKKAFIAVQIDGQEDMQTG